MKLLPKLTDQERDFVRDIMDLDPLARVVVLGDCNDFAFAPSIQTMKSNMLVDLAEELLPPEERYTYVYRGNSQDLDHILASPALFRESAPEVWIPHRYAEYLYGVRQTDHDPVAAAFSFGSGR